MADAAPRSFGRDPAVSAVTPQKSDVEQVAAHRRIGYNSIAPIAADEPAGLIDIKARLMAGV
jgi:hypothetical protein